MTHPTKEWMTFLCYPIPLPDASGEPTQYALFGREQLTDLLKMALRSELLPSSTCLVQFIHVMDARRRERVKFGITTALVGDRAPDLLGKMAFHGAFVKRSEISFFKRVADQYADRGLVCVICGGDVPPFELSRVETAVIQRIPRPSYLPPPYTRFVEIEKLPGSQWGLIREEEADGIIDGGSSIEPDSAGLARYAKSAAPLARLLGDHSQSYLLHIAPFAFNGAVVLCTPRLFNSARPSADAAMVGGCMFVLDSPPQQEELQALYAVAYKLCLVAAGLEDAFERRTILDRERLFGFASHTIIGPIADARFFLRLSIADESRPQTTEIRHAIDILASLQDNTNTLLAVCSAERQAPDRCTDDSLAQVTPFACDTFLHDHLAQVREHREVDNLQPIEMHCSLRDIECLNVTTPNLLKVLLITLIRNAVDNIEEGFKKEMKAAECRLFVEAEIRDGECRITVRNGGRPVSRDEVNRLNQETPDDSAWRVSRKGEQHYSLGNRKVKWIAERCLGGRIEYDLEGQDFLASVFLPVGSPP